MLLASLFLVMGTAWAQTATTYADGLYKIHWEWDKRGYLAYHNTDYPTMPQLAGVVNHNPNGHYALDAEGINLGWYLYTSPKTEKSYLFEATTGKFITFNPADFNIANSKQCLLSTEVTDYAMLNLLATDNESAPAFALRYVFNGTNYQFCSGCGSNKGQNPVRFATNGQGDGGIPFKFVEDANLTITDEIKNAAIAKITAYEKFCPEYNGTRGRGDRKINTISLASGLSASNAANTTTLSHYGNGLLYADMTKTVTMKAYAGESVTAAVTVSGNWIHAYVYIDLGEEGFSAGIDADGFTPTGDLMSYSFYSPSGDPGKNSAGQELAGDNRNTLTMPSFVAPSTPGTYRMRFKTDWNSLEPGGGATFVADGGTIVDVALVVEERPAISYTVKYNFVYDGNVKYSQDNAEQYAGNKYPDITVALPYGIVAAKPEGEIDGSEAVDGIITKEIALSVDLPFEVSESFETATWYVLQIRGSQNVVMNHDNTVSSNAPLTASDAALWAFMGNPFDGIQVLNKAAGKRFTLSSNVKMEENASMSWNIFGNGNGFTLRNGDSGTNCLNDVNNGLSYWDHVNSPGDAGSRFTVVSEAEMIARANEALARVSTAIGSYDNIEASYYVYPQANVDAAKVALRGVGLNPVNILRALTVKAAAEAAEAALGSKSDGPKAGDVVSLKNRQYSDYLSVDGSNDLCGGAKGTYWTLKETDVDGYYYLYNEEKKVYAKPLEDRNNAKTSVTANEAEAGKYGFKQVENTYYAALHDNYLGANVGDVSYLHHSNWPDKKMVRWDMASGTQASHWLVSQVYPLTVVYNFEGSEDKEITTNVVAGDTYEVTNPYADRPYVAIETCSAEGSQPTKSGDTWSVVVNKPTTVTVNVTYNLPFEYADSKENITQWYYLKFHATDFNYLYYAADDEVLTTEKTAVDGDKDAYTWAFVGNPTDGFKVYNKKAEKYLDAVEEGAVVSADQEQVFTLTESSYAPKGFFMNAKDGDYTQRFNRNGGKVVYWSGADAGSTFTVELRPKEGFAAAEELLAANVSNHSDTPALGQYTTTAYNALKAANDDSNATVETIEEAIVAFKASLNMPVYLVSSAWDGGYPAGSAIYYDGANWMWKKANKFDRQMWMTIPGYTDTDVPSVKEYNAAGTHYGFCDYLTGTKMRDRDVQIVTISGWPEAYNLQSGEMAMHAADTRNLVAWYPATTSDNQASAWKIEYIGNSYSLSKLTEEKLEALADLHRAFYGKVYLANATFGSGLGQYQGNKESIMEALGEVAPTINLSLSVLADEGYTVEMIQDMTEALNALVVSINEPVDGRYYRIQGANYNVKPAGHYITNHTNSDGGRIALTEDANATTIYHYKDGKLQAYQNGKYIGVSSSHWTFADDAASASEIGFAASSYVAGAYTIKSADRYLRYKVHDGKAEIDRTESEGSANDAWFLQEIEGEAKTLIYIYKAGKSELARQEVEVIVGSAYPVPTAALPLGYIAPAALDGTVGEDETEKVIACTFDKSKMPFQYADSYENIEHWYYLNIGNSAHYLYHVDDADHIALNKTAVDANNKDAYSWAFIGNPTDGFQIVNKAKGEGWILSSSTTMAGTTGSGTWPIMTKLANLPDGNNTYWIHSKSTNRANRDGFYLEQKGYSANKMNNRSSKLAYWTDDVDAGSTLVAVEQYEMTQTYSGVGSWEVSPVYPEGLKTGAASGSHGSAADHVGASGHTIYKSTKAIVTTEADVKVSFNWVEGNAHGLIILGVDVVNGNGDVVASDYHVGFTGGGQDKKEYTLSGLPAGNYILRYYVCNESGDHELGATGGNIVVNFAKELTDVDAISAMWATLKTKGQSVLANKGEGLGYYYNTENLEEKMAATPENTIPDYTVAFVALDDAIDSTPLAVPEAGKFYRIQNYGKSGYLNSGASGTTQFSGTDNKESIFCFVDDKLVSYTTGMSFAISSNKLTYNETVGAGVTIKFEESRVAGKLQILFNGTRYLFSESAGNTDSGDTNAKYIDPAGRNANYLFTVTEVETLPVTISAASVNFNGDTKYVSTLFAPVALEVPAGITAYIGVKEDNYLNLEALVDIIPANTGVILMANETKAYDFRISAEAGTAIEDEDNIITGTVAKTFITPAANTTCYVLANPAGGNGVGLYRASLNRDANGNKVNEDGVSFLNNAFKAYVPVEDAQGANAPALVMRLGRGQGTTEIELPTANGQQPTAVYDLQGRRVLNPTKGMYIVNGKKVLF